MISSEPRLYIVIRKTADWNDEAAVRAQLPPVLVPRVDLWNETFAMPYHRFRARLREIAILNHSRVEGAIVAPYDQVPEGALIAPSDDDDWFAPTLVSELAARDRPDRAGYRWRATFLEVPPSFDEWVAALLRRIHPNRPLVWICTTNNHVVRKSPDTTDLVASHLRASAWFTENPARIDVLDGRLSVQNRNIASWTSLLRPLTRAGLLRKWIRYRWLYRHSRRSLPPWAYENARRMAALMDDVEPRGGIIRRFSRRWVLPR